MKVIPIIFLFISVISVTFAALAQYPPEGNDGKCHVDGVTYEPGTHTNPSPDKCFRVECQASGHAEVADCGVQMAGPNCKNNGLVDVSKPYPDCCKINWVCDNSSESSESNESNQKG